MQPHHARFLLALSLTLTMAACGGGDPPGADTTREQALSLSDAQRASAATATAQSSTNECAPIKPFYWEIGNRSGRLVSGSVDSPVSTTHYTSTLPMTIASASKWVYGAYVTQRVNGALSDSDRKFLSMRAGYVSFTACERGQTVDGCLATDSNGVYTPEADGRFQYSGGHMEKHASLSGLGPKNNASLASAIQSQIGSDVKFVYTQPQLAGGIATSPDAYALFLRKMLGGQLALGALLGSGAVCTNPLTCGFDKAIFAPIPPDESWHYSVGHWVEDDPVVGDGAFSSPGAFGFYPWIDKTKTYYGVVARVAQNGAFTSVRCGRLIRKAWVTGTAL